MGRIQTRCVFQTSLRSVCSCFWMDNSEISETYCCVCVCGDDEQRGVSGIVSTNASHFGCGRSVFGMGWWGASGDGAKWIGSIVFDVFGKTEECLDIYYRAETISDCGKVLFGGATERREWFERMRLVLLSECLVGIECELSSLLSGKLKKPERAAMTSLLEYFRNNAHRLNDAERLAAVWSRLLARVCWANASSRRERVGGCRGWTK